MQQGPALIADGIYWVGSSQRSGALQCNPYLILDGDEAVLVDPGSVLDFEDVLKNVKSLTPIDKISYVVLHHQDPDFCASVPSFEKEGAKFKIVTQWRAQVLIQYYGVRSDYYIVDEHDYRLRLRSGREITFVPTPYLHFPGGFASYDSKTKTLFSSDLFGSMSTEWSLFAQDGYIEKMKTFHEHDMPSNDILRPVMETFMMMDIRTIAPQHGSVIKQDVIAHIRALRDLECGTFLNLVKKNMKDAGGCIGVCGTVVRRLKSMYPHSEVMEALSGLGLDLDRETGDIKDCNSSGLELWEKLFDAIYRNKGLKWLLAIEPLAYRLSREYDLPLPRIFRSQVKNAHQEAEILKEEVLELRQIVERLNKNVEQAQGTMTTCPVTGLYNEDFLKAYLETELANVDTKDYENRCLALLSIDNISRLQFLFGTAEVDNTIRGVASLIAEMSHDGHLLFRLQGPVIACFMPNTAKAAAESFADECRNRIKASRRFVEEVTVSVGVSCLRELATGGIAVEEMPSRMLSIAATRVRIARSKGGDTVWAQSDVNESEQDQGTILICDPDRANREVLKTQLVNKKYRVLTATNGEEALETAQREVPDLIVSEIMLPKIDGLVLAERLRLESTTKDIPFIIVSDMKDQASVSRALSLRIEHYFKKPYMLSEVVGIIQMKVKRENPNAD